jgi:hypothetical protein
MFNIKHNISDVLKDFKQLKQNVVKAQKSANKKIAQQVVTQLTSTTRDRYNIKSKDLKEGTKVKSDDGNQVTSRITFSMRRTPLIQFGARKGSKGASVVVLKGGRKLIGGSFIPSLNGGHQNIFVRARYGSTRVARLPIKQLYGPSPAQMLFNKAAENIALKLINDKWNKIYQHELEYYSKK